MIKAVTIYNKIDRLRKAIRREGTPAVQNAWDELEPHVSIFFKGDRDDRPADQNDQNGSRSGDLG